MITKKLLYLFVLSFACVACSTSSFTSRIHAVGRIANAVDPLSASWQVESDKIATDKFKISLRKKGLSIGGDGEANQVFSNYAKKLVKQHGYATFKILSYSEGIESATHFSERVAEGIIEASNIATTNTTKIN